MIFSEPGLFVRGLRTLCPQGKEIARYQLCQDEIQISVEIGFEKGKSQTKSVPEGHRVIHRFSRMERVVSPGKRLRNQVAVIGGDDQSDICRKSGDPPVEEGAKMVEERIFRREVKIVEQDECELRPVVQRVDQREEMGNSFPVDLDQTAGGDSGGFVVHVRPVPGFENQGCLPCSPESVDERRDRGEPGFKACKVPEEDLLRAGQAQETFPWGRPEVLYRVKDRGIPSGGKKAIGGRGMGKGRLERIQILVQERLPRITGRVRTCLTPSCQP